MTPTRRAHALKKAGLAPRQFGELLGIAPATVRVWLRTDRLPRLALALLALLEAAPRETVRALRRSRAAEVRAVSDRLAQILRETGRAVADVIPSRARRRPSPQGRRRSS